MHLSSHLAAVMALTVTASAQQSLHLVNCAAESQNGLSSVIFFYSDDSQSNSLTFPPSSNQCGVSNGFLFHWEAGNTDCTFPTGVSVDVDIPTDAQTSAFPLFSFVGPASNSAGTTFSCFKDNGRVIAQTDGAVCTSIYYCLQN